MFEEIRKAGFTRARVDGNVHSLDDEINLDRYKQHTIEAVVDRLVISQNGDKEDQKAEQQIFQGILQDNVINYVPESESYAAFGEATFSLTDAFRLIAGASLRRP